MDGFADRGDARGGRVLVERGQDGGEPGSAARVPPRPSPRERAAKPCGETGRRAGKFAYSPVVDGAGCEDERAMTPGRCCRAVRAVVFAAACVLLTALGHIVMSATPLPWWALAGALAATGATAWVFTRRERGLPFVVPAAVVVQAVLHTAFSLAQATVHPSLPDRGSLTRRWTRYLLGDTHGSTPTGMPVPGTGEMHHPGPDGLTEHAVMMSAGHDMAGRSLMGMLLAHLLAALLCGLWLACGERAAFRLLRACAGWLVAPLRLVLRLPAPADRPRVRARRSHRARTLRQLLLVHALGTRGPPSRIAVF